MGLGLCVELEPRADDGLDVAKGAFVMLLLLLLVGVECCWEDVWRGGDEDEDESDTRRFSQLTAFICKAVCQTKRADSTLKWDQTGLSSSSAPDQ
jgi:hypothetical protein